MYIHSPNLSSKFRLLYPTEKSMYVFYKHIKPNTYKTTLSIPIQAPLPNLHPNHSSSVLPSLWMVSQSIQWLKPEIRKSPRALPLLYTHIQHQVLQFYIIACLGPSHLWSRYLMSPSQKGLLCPPYHSIHFLLLSFISHITICNVTFACLPVCLFPLLC